MRGRGFCSGVFRGGSNGCRKGLGNSRESGRRGRVVFLGVERVLRRDWWRGFEGLRMSGEWREWRERKMVEIVESLVDCTFWLVGEQWRI